MTHDIYSPKPVPRLRAVKPPTGVRQNCTYAVGVPPLQVDALSPRVTVLCLTAGFRVQGPGFKVPPQTLWLNS